MLLRQGGLIIILLVWLCSCASEPRNPQALVKIPTSGPRFDVPETTGGWGHAEFDASFQGGHRLNYDLASDAMAPEITPITNFSLGAGVGLTKRLDLDLELWSLAKAKYQLLGHSEAESDVGNFSLALIGAFGYTGGEYTTTTNTSEHTGAPAGSYESVKVEEVGILEGALSLGYRTHKNLLVYTTPFITYREFTGSYDSDLTAKTNTIKKKGIIANYGLGLGFEYRINRLRIAAEFTGMNTRTVHRVQKFSVLSGLQAGMAF
jgi:hypothetical protein